MKPKIIFSINDQNLPMVLKYQEKEYLIKSTASGSLHMSRETEDRPEPPSPPPLVDPCPKVFDL